MTYYDDDDERPDWHWAAPGFDPSHDLRMGSEYEITPRLDATAAGLLDELWVSLQALEDEDGVIVPFAVAQPEAGILEGDVARYCFGTGNGGPMMLVDWERIQEAYGSFESQHIELVASVLHELRHAWQEREDLLHPFLDSDEREDIEQDAEGWARAYQRKIAPLRPSLDAQLPSAPAKPSDSPELPR